MKARREETGRDYIDFSASINPFPPKVPFKFDEHLIRDYPDDSYAKLKEMIAARFHRDPEEVAVGNGSIELIRVFSQVMLTQGGKFWIEEPTFGEYRLSAGIAGAREVSTPKEATVGFICNPNNPTGALMSQDAVAEIHATWQVYETFLFLDEAFIELADPSQSYAPDRCRGVFVSRSLTKSFAVPGLRFGYGFGEPSLVANMETVRPPWSVNAVAEAFAIEAFRHYDALSDSTRALARERTWFYEALIKAGLSPRPSSANYFLIDLEKPAGPVVAALEQHGILVRDCKSFGLPAAIRVAVRSHEENIRFVEALTACWH